VATETDYAIFQPDLSYQIDIYDEGNRAFRGTYTISELLSLLQQIPSCEDCDSVLIAKGTNIQQGYSIFTPLKIGSRTSYYVGDNSLYEPAGNRQYVLWQYDNGIYDGKYYGFYNSTSLSSVNSNYSRETIDGIEYYWDYWPQNNSYKPILYITSSVDRVVINSHPEISNGGGATHIATRTGTLMSIGSSNLSDVLIVSGGGGGGVLVGETANGGADAGGISGNGTLSADQTTGYGFGQGESGADVSSGGGGLYGGYKGTSALSGGAGSGYIGNSDLSNKKMVGYDVPTSSSTSTKTESVNDASATPISGKPKIGNGFVRITLLSASTVE